MQAVHVNLLDQLALFTELRVSSEIFGRILQTFFYKISHFFEKKNKQKRSVISQNFFSKMQN